MKRPVSQVGMKWVVEALGRLPHRLKSAIGGSRLNQPGHVLSAEVAMFLRLMGDRELARPQHQPLDKVREQTDHDAWVFGGCDAPVDLERSFTIDGQGGPVPVKTFVTNDCAQGVLIYFHGGAWVSGSLASCESICRYLAREARLHVLSVDYRLAPEHPFPAAIDDALAAYEHVLKDMQAANTPGAFIAVAGDSAGGNIAAALCYTLREQKRRLPDFQLLFYPVLDNENRSTSYSLFETGYVLTADQMNWARELYVPSRAYSDPAVSPLLADSFEGLPPTYIATAEFDVLRDEGEAYAHLLSAAGVNVTLRRAAGLIHGFANMMGVSRVARQEMQQAVAALVRSRQAHGGK